MKTVVSESWSLWTVMVDDVLLEGGTVSVI